ncbi:MAG: hypothetical protein DMG11_09010 [Acidobacteria bacterium]|nr:MAG: hypothetical protein DMG11_09010 [Acidobacteriota bacterium]
MHTGAETMLYQEQLVTLQKSAYDDAMFQKALQINQKWSEGWLPTFGMAQPNKIVFDAACSAKGAPFLEMHGGNLGDKAWRWCAYLHRGGPSPSLRRASRQSISGMGLFRECE